MNVMASKAKQLLDMARDNKASAPVLAKLERKYRYVLRREKGKSNEQRKMGTLSMLL